MPLLGCHLFSLVTQWKSGRIQMCAHLREPNKAVIIDDSTNMLLQSRKLSPAPTCRWYLHLGYRAVTYLHLVMSLHPINRSLTTYGTTDYKGCISWRHMCYKMVCPSYVLQLQYYLPSRKLNCTWRLHVSLTTAFCFSNNLSSTPALKWSRVCFITNNCQQDCFCCWSGLWLWFNFGAHRALFHHF